MTGLESIENNDPEIEFLLIDDVKNTFEEPKAQRPRPGVKSDLNRMLSEFDQEFTIESQKNSLSIEALNAQARDNFTKGNYKAATEIYQQILTTYHYNLEILFDTYKNLGNIALTTSDFDGAEENFNKAHTIDSKSDILFVNYGILEIQRKNLAKAVERFRQAIEINSKNDKAWVGLALVHREFNDHELSWADLHRALDENPGNETALALSIEWGVSDGRLGSSANFLKNYLANVNDSTEMRLALSKILYCQGDYLQARETILPLLKNQSTNREAQQVFNLIELELTKV
ncbi:MAG: tetratricopeptide repeat protein [Pseudomonadota bacterium]|nr:tetratricopeptide repeat protein [Pseudomonadota bacterium]